MFFLLWGVGILNYTDAAQTIYLLNVKFMVEANRFMAFLLDHSPYTFWMYKTLVPTFGCVLLWRFRKKVKWLPDGGYEVEVPYASEKELAMDILKHGAEVEVMGPRSLRDEIARRLQEAAARY